MPAHPAALPPRTTGREESLHAGDPGLAPTAHQALCSPVSIWTMAVAALESSLKWSGAIFSAEKQSFTTEDCCLQTSVCDSDGPATRAAKYIRGEGAIPTRKLKYALSWTVAPRCHRTLGVKARIQSPRLGSGGGIGVGDKAINLHSG